jgi:hypothetical protein
MKIVNVLVKIFVIDDDEGSGNAASTMIACSCSLGFPTITRGGFSPPFRGRTSDIKIERRMNCLFITAEGRPSHIIPPFPTFVNDRPFSISIRAHHSFSVR